MNRKKKIIFIQVRMTGIVIAKYIFFARFHELEISMNKRNKKSPTKKRQFFKTLFFNNNPPVM